MKTFATVWQKSSQSATMFSYELDTFRSGATDCKMENLRATASSSWLLFVISRMSWKSWDRGGSFSSSSLIVVSNVQHCDLSRTSSYSIGYRKFSYSLPVCNAIPHTVGVITDLVGGLKRPSSILTHVCVHLKFAQMKMQHTSIAYWKNLRIWRN